MMDERTELNYTVNALEGIFEVVIMINHKFSNSFVPADCPFCHSEKFFLMHIPAMLIYVYILKGYGERLMEMSVVVLLTIVSKYIPICIRKVKGNEI